MSTKTINFLPEVFKTPANRKFLNATVDQLIAEPNFKKLNGYIGRKFAPTYHSTDNYLPEPSTSRQNYQFEPSVVSTDSDNNINFFGSYTDLLQQIEYYGGSAANHSRLFANEAYSFNGLVDFDKLVNFNQYYWMPHGPDAVEVFTGLVDTDSTFTVTRDTSTNSYKFSNAKNSENPDIVLARGGTYTFIVNQPGFKFWIQTDPGVSGFRKNQANINTRNVMGVSENGTDAGTITFTVPPITAQAFYTEMPYAATDVDYASTTAFSQLSNQLLSTVIKNGGIDGATDIVAGRKLIFINNDMTDDAWKEPGIYANGNWGEDGSMTDGTPLVPSVITNRIPYSAGRIITGDARFGVWEIAIIEVNGDKVVRLNPITPIPVRNKVYIKAGSLNAAKEFYRSDERTITEVPLITATLTELWYNDGTDQQFFGRIKLVTNPDNPLDVTDFLGKKQYISPNKVTFTNGLKINFGRNVVQEEYRGKDYYVEGVGTSIRLVDVSSLITPEFDTNVDTVPFDLYGYDDGEYDQILDGPLTPDYITINRASVDGNAWSRTNRWFHTDVILATATYNNTTPNVDYTMRAKRPIIEFEADLKLFNYGTNYHSNIDVLDFTVVSAMNEVEGSIVNRLVIDPGTSTDPFNVNDFLGQTEYVGPNNVKFANGLLIIFGQKIVQAEYRGKNYYVTGVGSSIQLVQTSKYKTFWESAGISRNAQIIFANDSDVTVKDKVFSIDAIDINAVKKAHLTDLVNEPIVTNQSVTAKSSVLVPLVPLSGATKAQLFNKDARQIDFSKLPAKMASAGIVLTGVLADNVGLVTGTTFWFNGTEWVAAQQKTTINVPPLFDILDENKHSASDVAFYPGTTFTGSKIFSYKTGNGHTDTVLKFPLSYRNFSNIGDIVFQNNFDTEEFTTILNKVKTPHLIGNMFVGKITDIDTFALRNLWEKNVEQTKQYQNISHICDGKTSFFEIDILPKKNKRTPNIKVYVNNKLITTTDYMIVSYGVRLAVKILSTIAAGDKVDIFLHSESVSALGYYEVPPSLEFNALNAKFDNLSLGQISSHVTALAENSLSITGNVPGNSNLRDIFVKDIGGKILQHSAPAAYSSVFLLNSNTNFIDSITLAQNEYVKFKNRFLESYAMVVDAGVTDPATGVDMIMKSLNAVKNRQMPWYYSDMVPYDANRSMITDIVLNEEIAEYEIDSIFNDIDLGSKAVLVYVNGVQLVKGQDYIFNQTRPAVKFLHKLSYDDVITITTFNNTDGCYVPETPTKLGLYPKFVPEVFLDNTYTTPINAIRGHDGSITPAFGDIRDNLLMELELRIYNNIKAVYDHHTFDINSVVPGRFRNTNYAKSDFDNIVSRNFLRWLGNNKVDYSSNQWYTSGNPFSWTYNAFTDTVNGSALPGYWRGIFNYFYDTDAPHARPWECLGFGMKPTWWENYYGPAPYTGGNLVLWGDLELGLIREGTRAGIDVNYARPGLSKIIPVTENGELRAPYEFLVSNFDGGKTDLAFAIGDGGPVESAWRKSSNYPFAVQQALALMRPGVYFGQLSSVHDYYRNSLIDQFTSSVSNRRLTKLDFKINGKLVGKEVTRNAGYLNWVVDYITSNGLTPDSILTPLLENLDVKLAYKMAGFSDKTFLRVLAEQSSPSSTNSSIMVPDENYAVYLHKSSPVERLSYSAVIIEKTAAGFSVSGYDIANPYFTIIPSEVTSNNYTINIFNSSATIYSDYQRVKLDIPYGTEFKNKQQVVDFLVSYGRYLESQGFIFDEFNRELGEAMDWPLSAKEFLTWSQQGWAIGNIVVLSPVKDKIKVIYANAVADQINNLPLGSKILDTNFNLIPTTEFNVVREGQTFEIGSAVGNTVGFADIDMVQFEHVLVFDNKTAFNDVIYSPELGNRQFRLKVIGNKTGAWDGQLTPPGFIYYGAAYKNWSSGSDYRKGEIVKYKNIIYTAIDNIDAATAFNFGQWAVAVNQSIKPSLLPNLSYNASKFIDMYDVDSNVVNEKIQSHSSNLIGYQERSYLTDLGINSTSQTKFYQGYIRDKGTTDAITALTSATFNNLMGDVQVNEEWAFRVGEYGATGTDKFVEVQLSDSKYKNIPLTVEFTEPGAVASTIAAVAENKNTLYKKSREFTPTLFNNRSVTSLYDGDLLTAGYVNLNDIDATVFDLQHSSALDALLPRLYAGFKIWVAKDLKSDWNVFRVSQAAAMLTNVDYNLDTTARFSTDGPHHLAVNDIFTVKNFMDSVDGFYKVTQVEDANTIVAAISTTLEKSMLTVPSLEGTGTMFTLYSLRVNEIVDIVTKTPPVFDWLDTDMLWVDNTIDAKWGVYKKSSLWDFSANLTEFTEVANGNFGATVSTFNGSVVIVTSPGNTSNSLTMYVKSATGEYLKSSSITHLLKYRDNGVGGIEEYNNNYIVGKTAAMNTKSYVVSAQNAHTDPLDLSTKLLHYSLENLQQASIEPDEIVLPNDSYGHSIAISKDDMWFFVSSPTEGTVLCFAKFIMTFDNSTTTFTKTILSDPILVDTLVLPGINFGDSIATNSDGSLLVISATTAPSNAIVNAGKVFVYKRAEPVPGTFTFTTVTDVIESLVPQANEKFGQTVMFTANNELLIGSPFQITDDNHAGVVYRLVNDGTGNFNIVQVIKKPFSESLEYFGVAFAEDTATGAIAISSSGATNFGPMQIDNTDFLLDSGTTMFSDSIPNAGAVYVYEPLRSATETVYSFTQSLSSSVISMGDNFGAALAAANGGIFVGSPTNDHTALDVGGVAYFTNKNKTPGWALFRSESPTVDLESIDGLMVYSKKTQQIIDTLDYIDPAKGKILGIAEQDITYKTSYDPAQYNTTHVADTTLDQTFVWGEEKVGQVWWDLSKVRYIDYEQDGLDYRIRHWGQMFPGSEIVVCEWVKSTVPPASYTGPGVPVYSSNTAYTEKLAVNNVTGVIQSTYYFWVTGKDTLDAATNTRRASIVRIASLINSPATEGIAYAEVIKDNAVALVNIDSLLSADDTILRVNYSNIKNSILSHNEYELVKENSTFAKIPDKIVAKLIDSLAGTDMMGNLVPDNKLTPAERYGVAIRPKQTMIVNRQKALRVFAGYVNSVLKKQPAASEFNLDTLYLVENIPTEYMYIAEVNTIEELSYLNPHALPVDGKVLVKSDNGYNNQWAIYIVQADFTYTIFRTQSYATTDYWEFDDWYDSAFDFTVKPTYTVPTFKDISKLTKLAYSNVVFVKDNGKGKFAFYRIEADLTHTLVGLQDGTIQISNSFWAHESSDIGFDNANFDEVRFDLNPTIEIRNIFNAVKNDLFTGALEGEFNNLFFIMLNYILSEQRMVDWAFKTSFISVLHKLRKLEQFPSYIRDNQTFYEEYIKEVKPYRTKIREYIVEYEAATTANVTPTDFDLPAYFDTDLNVWRSPSGEHARDDLLLASDTKYADWKANYTYSIESVKMSSQGYGYSLPPTVLAVGGGGSGAVLEAVIDFYTGAIVKINVINPGSGYTSTPELQILGDGIDAAGEQTAKGYVMMRNNTIRSFDSTLTFDRISYVPDTIDAANSYSNAANRVDQFYNPVPGMPPKDYARLFTGGGYTADQVVGATFLDTDEEKTIIESFFNVPDADGSIELGNSYFIDKYNSHAPEEYVPGLMLDTLDMQVFTLPADMSTTQVIGYRIVKPMKYVANYATTLAADLLPADLTIQLTDVSMFSDPTFSHFDASVPPQPVYKTYDQVNPLPVFIEGEKFLFYGVDYVANTLTLRSRDINTVIHPMARTTEVSPGNFTTVMTEVFTSAPDWEFKRISAASTTTLVAPLYSQDSWIVTFDTGSKVVRALNEADALLFARKQTGNTSALVSVVKAPGQIAVADTSGLPTPNPSLLRPGVVYINGERIVYYGIDRSNNLLLNLRRGTNGTGVAAVHDIGSRVVDASEYQTIPGDTAVPQRTWLNDSVPNADNVIAVPYATTDRIVDGVGLFDSGTIQARFLHAGRSFLPSAPGDLGGRIDPNANNTRFDDDGFGEYGTPVHPYDIDPFDSYIIG
jgi:hypothetical protein